MRHGADGWWWAVCNEGMYKQPEPIVKKLGGGGTRPAGGRETPLWPGGGDTARLRTEVCTQGAEWRRRGGEGRRTPETIVPASEGAECNGDSGKACGLSCPTNLGLRRPWANPSASVAQGEGGRQRQRAGQVRAGQGRADGVPGRVRSEACRKWLAGFFPLNRAADG